MLKVNAAKQRAVLIRCLVSGVLNDAISWSQARQRLTAWAVARESRYVCICNLQSVVTASKDRIFRQILENADLATPDGAPVACARFAPCGAKDLPVSRASVALT